MQLPLYRSLGRDTAPSSTPSEMLLTTIVLLCDQLIDPYTRHQHHLVCVALPLSSRVMGYETAQTHACEWATGMKDN
ncbi:hypothetical protein BHE74_00038950 [Ensete ventricosum]|nr:hypothetical protein BHE74_00038950 [Ensete ventricosum]